MTSQPFTTYVGTTPSRATTECSRGMVVGRSRRSARHRGRCRERGAPSLAGQGLRLLLGRSGGRGLRKRLLAPTEQRNSGLRCATRSDVVSRLFGTHRGYLEVSHSYLRIREGAAAGAAVRRAPRPRLTS